MNSNVDQEGLAQRHEGNAQELLIEGASCASCVRKIESALIRDMGVRVKRDVGRGDRALTAAAAGADVLALGSALGAVAGLLHAFQFSVFQPLDFETLISFYAFIIIIMGGIGSRATSEARLNPADLR